MRARASWCRLSSPSSFSSYPGGIPSLLAAAVVTATAVPTLAGPEGEQVTNGQATFQRAGDLTVIHASNNAVINYRSFDIGAHEKVQFVQPDALSRVLNRINSAAPTRIDGTLSANGRVYIINPAGVMFGKGAVIDVARIFAAGGNLADADFLNKIDRFTDLKGAVVNNGSISADAVGLLGSTVANHGTIVADKGAVIMTAGDEVFIGEQGGHLFAKIKAEPSSDGSSSSAAAAAAGSTPGVENTGTIRAKRISMTSGDLYSVAIRNTGKLRAKKIDIEGGSGGVNGSLVQASGVIDASDPTPGAQGGEVRILGETVALTSASVNASGSASGGTVLIGGNIQGQGPERHAETTLISSDSTIRADALHSGNGGTVAVWSDSATGFYGSISTKGAAPTPFSPAGKGGFVETSSKGVLDMRGQVRAGNGGAWLIDPRNITIDDVVTPSDPITGGVFTPSVDNAVVDASEINDNLNGGVSVTITTDGGGVQDGNVQQLATGAISKTVASPATLTINAAGTITLDGGINTAVGSQATDVTLTANQTQAGDPTPLAGDVILNATVDTKGGSFTSTGVNFNSTAAGNITTSGGAVNITHSGNITVGASIVGGGGNVTLSANGAGSTLNLNGPINTGAGNITLDSDAGTSLGAAGDLSTNTGDILIGNTLAGPISTAGNITTDGGDVTYARAVTLTGPVAIGTNLGSGSGSVTFSSTLNGPFDFAVNAGSAAVTFNGAVGGVTPVGDGVGVAIDVSSGTGATIFNSTLATASGLRVAAGPTTLTGNVNLGNGDTASSFGGSVTLDGLTLTAADGATFGDAAADVVTLSGGAVSLGSTNAPFVFHAAVDGAQNLTINSGSAATTFNAAVGGATPIGDGSAAALTLNTPTGLTTFNNSFRSAGRVIAAGPVTFTQNVTITGTGISAFDGDVTLDGLTFTAPAVRFGPTSGASTLTLSGGAVSIVGTGTGVQIESDVAGAQDLTVDTIAGTTFGGTVNVGDGTGASLILDDGGATFEENVTAAAGITLNSTAEFKKLVAAAAPITSTGNTIFRDDVTVTGTGVSVFDANTTLDGLTFFAPGVRFGSVGGTNTLTLSGGPVAITTTAVGAQFESFVDGDQNLTLNTADGADFKRDVGATTPLGTGAASSTAIRVDAGLTRFRGRLFIAEAISSDAAVEFLDSITAAGAGTSLFNNNVTFDKAAGLTFQAPSARFGTVSGSDTLTLLNGPVTLSATTGGLQVEASVTGTQDLTVNSITGADFKRAVGSSGTPLGDGAGAALTIQSGDALFRSTINTAGRVIASSPIGSPSTIEFRNNVTVGGSGVSAFDANVAFNGTVTFSAPGVRFGASGGPHAITLAGGPVMLASTAVGIQVESTVNGAQNLSVDPFTLIDFRQPVGGVTPIGTGASGSTALSIDGSALFRSTLSTAERIVATAPAEFRGNTTVAGAGLSTFSQNVTLNNMTFAAAAGAAFGDAPSDQLTLNGSAVTVSSTNAPLTFNARVDGPASLTTTSGSGATAFNAAVGSSTRLASLSSSSSNSITAASTLSTTGTVALSGTGSKALSGAVAADGGFSSVGSTFSNTGAPITTVNNSIAIGHAGVITLDAPLSSGAGGIAIGSDTSISASALADITTTTGNVSFGPVRTGPLNTAGDITTAGGAITFNRPVNLTGPVALASTSGGPGASGAITFASTLDGAADLSLNSGSATATFSGAVGNSTPLGDGVGPAISVSSATGSTLFNSTLVTASGITAASGPVTFTNNVTLGNGDTASTFAGNVTLDGLAFTAADGATFGDGPTDQVTLSGGPVAIATTNSPIIFAGLIDGAQNLTLNAGSAATTFNGLVGSATAIGTGVGPALTIDSAGLTTFASTVHTASGIDVDGPVTFITSVALDFGDTPSVFRGDVTFNSPGGLIFSASGGAAFGDSAADQVTIGGGSVLIRSDSSAPLTFNAKIDSGVSGPQPLEIDAGLGAVTLNAPVGSTRPLASLTITGSPIRLGPVTTTGTQTYIGPSTLAGALSAGGAFDFNGPVTLLADTTITTTAGDIAFRSTVDTDGAAGSPVALRAETAGTARALSFQGAVGASRPLSTLTTVNPAGPTNFSGGSVTTTGAQDYTGPAVLQTNTTFTAASARFRNAISATPAVELSVNTPGGTAAFDGPIGGGPDRVTIFSVQAADIALNGGSVLTTSTQTYDGPVTLDADTSLSTFGGDIFFNSTLNGARDLAISAPNGSVIFGGDVGSTSTPLGNPASTSPILIDSNVIFSSPTLTSFTARNGVNLGPDGIRILHIGSGGVAFSSAPGNGSFRLNAEIGDAGPLSVNAGSGNVAFLGDVGPVFLITPASLSVTGSSVSLRNVTTVGAQTYTGATTLAGNLAVAGPGAIAVNGPLAIGSDALIRTAGDDISITDAVSTTTPSSGFNLAIDANGGDITLGGAVGADLSTAPGNLTANGGSISLPAVNTRGSQVYTGNSTLSGNLNAGGLVTFNGNTALANGINISASSASFLGTLTGPHDLTVNATTINLGGDVALGDGLTATPIALNGNVAFSQTPTQSFTTPDGAVFGIASNHNVTLNGGAVDITSGAGGGSFIFNGAVNGASPLSVNAGTGLVSFNGLVGQTIALTSLDVTASDMGLAGVTTTGSQTYNGRSSIRGAFTSTGTGAINVNGASNLAGSTAVTTAGGVISFVNTIDGAHNLTINSSAGESSFGGDIGSTTPVGGGAGAALTVNSSGLTTFNGAVTTNSGIVGNNLNGRIVFNRDVSAGNGDVSSLFRGPVTLGGISFTVADGVTFGSDVLVAGETNAIQGTLDGTGRVVFRGALNAIPGTSPAVTITSAVTRPPDGSGSASPAVLAQPAIMLGNVGNITPLASLTLGGPLASVPKEANILLGNDVNGDGVIRTNEVNINDTFSIRTTGDFIMGQNQKLTALGNLTIISDGNVALGDLSSLGSINVTAGSGQDHEIRLLKRERTPGGIYDTSGLSGDFSSDLGLDIVAAGAINFSRPPSGVTPTDVDFANNSGAPGTSLSGFSFRTYTNGVRTDLLTQGGATAILSLDLRAQGPTETNIASALAGALPRTDEGPEPYSAAISESLRAQLEQMGIFVKDLQMDEVIEFLVGRTVYRDNPDLVRPSAGDYRISSSRLPGDVVEQVVVLYTALRDRPAKDENGHPILDETGKPVMIEQWELIRDVFATAWADFMNEVAPPDAEPPAEPPTGMAFRNWLESKYPNASASEEPGAQALNYLDQVRSLFHGLDGMGLSPQEVKYPKNKIVGDLTPPDMDPTQMEEAILGSASANKRPAPLSLSR